MWTTLLIVLAIIPWSLIFGVAYLAYRRVRGQQAPVVQTCTRPSPHECTVNEPCNGYPRPTDLFNYQEAKTGWQVCDADYIAREGKA